jgi:RNA polymerase sigma-70 factor, ECF subfamily
MQLHATRLLGNRALAENVVEEALIRLWRNREVLTNRKGSLCGWLLPVVHNMAIDRIRIREARPREVAESPNHQPVSRDQSDTVVAALIVHAALDILSADHRAVLEQVYDGTWTRSPMFWVYQRAP